MRRRRDIPDWEYGIGKPPMWVRLVAWVSVGSLVVIVALAGWLGAGGPLPW